jgi:hypothetical protein
MAKFAAGGYSSSERFVYLDLDFADSRSAYKRAIDFVSANSIKYALSSNVLTELGGREILSVPELFANDFVWSAANPGRVLTSPQRATRLIFSLDQVNFWLYALEVKEFRKTAIYHCLIRILGSTAIILASVLYKVGIFSSAMAQVGSLSGARNLKMMQMD